ncbi:flagellar protein FlgN [Alkaliphilus pronyensis]|uniref:Flagellar protein FlgN n=1 Tax=Alkaliphilus pronyensis TaxID=1482732 RepID=A0A6I0F9L3_9FIRM|nr:flagellar protein FlgN [Alkaliphilus pronyensis]KAB3539651.1 flagellar protein FlgN [Alkaliphilus pronyensis]
MRPEKIVIELQNICNHKLNIMKQILSLTIAQKEALTNKEDQGINLLNQIIEEKQSLIDIVNQLDHDFITNYEAIKKLLKIDSFEECTEEPVKGFKQLKDTVNEIVNVTKDISQLDKENMEMANSNMNELKAQLKNIKTGKKVINSYNRKYVETPSILIDKKR